MKKVWVNVLKHCQGSERETTGALSGPKHFAPGVQKVEESLAKVFVDELKWAQPAEEPKASQPPSDEEPTDPAEETDPQTETPSDETPTNGGKKRKNKKGAPENKAQG